MRKSELIPDVTERIAGGISANRVAAMHCYDAPVIDVLVGVADVDDLRTTLLAWPERIVCSICDAIPR